MNDSPIIEVRFPFPDSALPRLWDWLNAFRKNVADDQAPQTLEEFVDLELARTAAGVRKFGVYRDDELGGCLWIQQVNDIVVTAHTCFKKEFFGRRTTLPALMMMADTIFDLGFKKISMECFDHNHAVMALLGKLGAQREGILRNQTTQGGSPVNIALFALHADRWANQRPKIAA